MIVRALAVWIGFSLAPLAGLAQEAPPRIPVRAFFANPTYSSPRISPDGAHLAVLVSGGDQQAVVSRPRLGGEFAVLAKLTDPSVRLDWLEWANDTRIVVSATQRREVNNESRRHNFLYGVDRDGGNFRWLGERWPRFGQYLVQFQDRVIHWLPEDPDHVLIEYFAAEHGGMRVMRMNVRTGDIGTRQREEHGISSWHADRDGAVRVGESIGVDLRYGLWAKRPGEKFFREVASHTLYSELGTRFADFHDDPGKLYVVGPHGGRDAIFEFDVASGEIGKLVFAHPRYDVRALVREAGPARRAIGVKFDADDPMFEFFEAGDAAEWQSLQRIFAAEFGRPVFHEIASSSADGRFVLLHVRSDVQPSTYYAYDRQKRSVAHLVDQYPELPAERMAPMRSISYVARDGRRIPGYLTLPLGGDGKRLPAIVLPHGGPFVRDVRDWNAEVQLLANRGFAVLQPNFRGSDGFGAEHRSAGFREFGLAMQDDLTDGVRWMIAEGIADPDRIGIYGASYGGYAALIGATKTLDLYRAAAAYAPVTDLELMLDDSASFAGHVPFARPLVGGERGDTERIRNNSPLRLAKQAAIPVLIGHGEEDDVVPVHHSRQMAKALRAAGKDVTYLEFPHEIHGFLLEANRIRWYEALIAFFEKNLAPRAAQANAAAEPKPAAAP